MARRFSHHLKILTGTSLGGISCSTSSCAFAGSSDSEPWNSSYISLGIRQPAVIADRAVMNKLYVQDIHKLQQIVRPCPDHTPLNMQPAYSRGGTARVRILTWNINMLCGPDGSASVGSHKRIDPYQVAEVIKRTNADIICLQETIDWIPPPYKAFLESHGVGDMDQRMRRLNEQLREIGFSKLLRSCAPPSHGSPNLVGSRMAVLHEETFELAPDMARAYGQQSRSAAYVEVQIAKQGNISLGVYVTHLHHMNQVPFEGRRAVEIESLLDHVSSRKQNTHRIATVVTGDFNQARREDYTNDEWDVIAAGLSKVQQPQIDGVSQALQKSGFACAYDIAPPLSNFGGRTAPPFTHWTGTTVDYLYFLDEHAVCERNNSAGPLKPTVLGTYVVFSDLSDHLPIVTDLAIEMPSSSLSSL